MERSIISHILLVNPISHVGRTRNLSHSGMVILGFAAHQRNKIAVQEIICLDVAFYLLHRLGAEQRIERFIIIYQFLERINIIGLRIDELADALRDGLITSEQMQMALRRLDKLLSLIYKGGFPRLQKYIEDYEYNQND